MSVVLVVGKTSVTFGGRRRFPFVAIVEWWREKTGPRRRLGLGLFWEEM